MSRWRAGLADTAYAVGWAVVRRGPERPLRAVFRRLADSTWRRRGRLVQQYERNLRRVLGAQTDDETLRTVSRAGLRSYLRYWFEVFRLPAWSPERVLRTVDVEHLSRIDDYVAQGRGVVLALPHMGNWDLAGAYLVHRGHPFTTVAERLRPERLFDRFLAFRRSLGMEVLALSGEQRRPYEVLRERLRDGRVVCLVAERDLTAAGIEVDFFGEPTRMPAGPAMLALATGAALVPVTLWYDGDRRMAGRLHDEVAPPATGDRRTKVTAMTQALADAFATDIAAHPQDWHMLQRLWVADLPEARRAALAGAGEGTPR